MKENIGLIAFGTAYIMGMLLLYVTIHKMVAAEKERDKRETALHAMVKDFYKYKYDFDTRKLPEFKFILPHTLYGKGFKVGDRYIPYNYTYNDFVDLLYYGQIGEGTPDTSGMTAENHITVALDRIS